jgi:hypothetical protein
MTLYIAIEKGTYRVEGKRLYAQDSSVWMRTNKPHITITGVSDEAYFPDVLKLPQEKLELIQLGWRASDEAEMSLRPAMGTTQPWQLIAWTSVRFGRVNVRIDIVHLTSDGATINFAIRSNYWEKPPKKEKAIERTMFYFKQGEWLPLLAMWLGDGMSRRYHIVRGVYHLMISAKEPEKIGRKCGPYQALIATGKDAYVRLKNSAGKYGVLLNITMSHKWVDLKLVTDDDFRREFKLRQKGLPVDVAESLPNISLVKLGDLEMRIHIVYGRGSDSLTLKYMAKTYDEAVEVAKRLEKMGLRPNIIRGRPYYIVYIATLDVIRLAEENETLRKKIADYLAFKAKYGTEKQKFIVARFLRKNPIFADLGLIPVMSILPALTSTA